jgi:hypothetical protein
MHDMTNRHDRGSRLRLALMLLLAACGSTRSAQSADARGGDP